MELERKYKYLVWYRSWKTLSFSLSLSLNLFGCVLSLTLLFLFPFFFLFLFLTSTNGQTRSDVGFCWIIRTAEIGIFGKWFRPVGMRHVCCQRPAQRDALTRAASRKERESSELNRPRVFLLARALHTRIVVLKKIKKNY